MNKLEEKKQMQIRLQGFTFERTLNMKKSHIMLSTRSKQRTTPAKNWEYCAVQTSRRELITAALLTTDKNCFRFGDYTVKIRNTRPPRYDPPLPLSPSEIHFQIKPGTKASSRCSHPARVTCIDARKQENPKNKLAS